MGVVATHRWLLPVSFALSLASGCDEAEATGDTVPSKPGAVQPAPNGTLTGEESACEAVRGAEVARRSALGCAPTGAPACPAYLRPAGGSACFRYDQGTVDACVAHLGALSSCEAFAREPCIVTAVPIEGCAGTGGAGGTAGAAGAGGAGTGGSGGTGAGGAGGAAGAGGRDGGGGAGTGGLAGAGGGGGGGGGGSGADGGAGAAGDASSD